MNSDLRLRPLACAAMLMAVTVQLEARAEAAPEYPLLAMASVDIIGTAPLAGLGVERDRLPYQVQTANARAIEQAPGENLSAYLARNLTGVNVNDISGSPFQSDITYRGFRASPVLGTSQGISVYLDGVRVNEPFGDVVNWDMLPEAAIAGVLLAPGSNPLYGLNTLGGALVLTSKSGRSHPGFEAQVSDSSSGQRRSDLAYGYDSGGYWHSFVAATVFNDRGWREHSDGRLGNLFAKLGGTAGGTDWTLALLGGSSRLVGNGLSPSYRVDDGGQQDGLYEADRRSAYTYPDQTRNRLRQLAFTLVQQLGEHAELSANVYARNSRRDTVNGDVGDNYADYVSDCADGFLADGQPVNPNACGYTRGQGRVLPNASLNTSSTRQQGRGASVSLSADLAAHQMLVGAAYDRSAVSYAQYQQDAVFAADRSVLADAGSARELDSSVVGVSRNIGLYAADTWALGGGTYLTGSARYNHAQVSNVLASDGLEQPQERFSYSKLNPALGLAHQLQAIAGLTLFANLAQSNRVPTVIELGCADAAQPCRLPVGLQSDPYLKQVVSRTIEAGMRWQGTAGASAALSAYRTINTDDILFLSSGASQQGYFSNVARTRHQGVDLSAQRQLGAWSAHMSYSYLDAAYDAAGDLFTGARNVQVAKGTRIAGLPRQTLKLGIDWKAAARLTVGADFSAVSNLVSQGNEDGLRADPQPGQPSPQADWSIRGYALLGLHASYRPAAGWEWYARINNAANRRYENYGALAVDMFPNGRLLQPADGAVQPSLSRFVAPGAPRSVVAGLRYRF